MKLIVFFIFLFSFSFVNASNIITHTNERRDNEEYFFLYGTSAGNYIVKSWQLDLSKIWNGSGEPQITTGQAISVALNYFNKYKKNLVLKEIMLRPSVSKNGSILWFYHVELTTFPYKFNSDVYELVILTSGDIVLPYKVQ